MFKIDFSKFKAVMSEFPKDFIQNVYYCESENIYYLVAKNLPEYVKATDAINGYESYEDMLIVLIDSLAVSTVPKLNRPDKPFWVYIVNESEVSENWETVI